MLPPPIKKSTSEFFRFFGNFRRNRTFFFYAHGTEESGWECVERCFRVRELPLQSHCCIDRLRNRSSYLNTFFDTWGTKTSIETASIDGGFNLGKQVISLIEHDFHLLLICGHIEVQLEELVAKKISSKNRQTAFRSSDIRQNLPRYLSSIWAFLSCQAKQSNSCHSRAPP